MACPVCLGSLLITSCDPPRAASGSPWPYRRQWTIYFHRLAPKVVFFVFPGSELIPLYPPFSCSFAHQPMPTWPSWQWWRSWSWRCRRQAPRRPPRRRQCLSQGCTGGCPLTFAETCLRKRPAHVGGATCAGSAARAGDGPSRVMGADDRTRVTTTASGIQFYAARAWRRGATSTCGSC